MAFLKFCRVETFPTELQATEFEEHHNLTQRVAPTGFVAVADVHRLIEPADAALADRASRRATA
jgi:hypothetical protein